MCVPESSRVRAKGEQTRRRIVSKAWELSLERGVEQILGAVTLREVAAEAGLSPSAVSYHFSSRRDLAIAMVEQLTESISMLPVELVDAATALAREDGLVAVARDAATLNWAALTSPVEVDFERRLARCVSVIGADGDGAGVASPLAFAQRFWVDQLTAVYERTAGVVGVRIAEPFTFRELACALSATAGGLLHYWMCDPSAIRDDLMADVSVALLSSVAVPTGRSASIGEISASLPRPPRTSLPEPTEDLALAEDVAELFATGVDRVTFTDVAAALGCRPEELVERFGSLRRLAALSFARHVATIDAAAHRRAGEGAVVRLTDAVYELARCVQRDPHCALALLFERLESRLEPIDALPEDDIRALVPLTGVIAEPLIELREEPDSVVADLALALVDTVLGYGATHPRAALGTVVELGMRLVAPAGF